MKLDADVLIATAEILSHAGGFSLEPFSQPFEDWAHSVSLPNDLFEFFRFHAPQGELWAGAGALFTERDIQHVNLTFPEALQNRLLILGSAANGDHIALDTESGVVGYISHEDEWRDHPRDYFIAVSPSLGIYLRDINADEAIVPNDYWEAKRNGAEISN